MFRWTEGGMILFALMSGGDYLPAGIRKCGPKLAAQIANAGFGADFLEIIYNNATDIDTELNKWRERLRYELRENKSGYFRKRHPAVQIPDAFPDRKILSDYTHPTVSSTEKLEVVRQSLVWDQNIDVVALWKFVGETLKWKHTSGMKKFIKAFAAPLVSHRLRLHLPLVAGCPDSSLLHNESLVRPQIYRGRALYSTDGLSELQLEIVPIDVVGLHLDCEINSPLWQKEEESGYGSSDLEITSTKRTSYEPIQRNKIWVFEAIAKLGIPDAVKTWEIKKQAGSKARKKKPLDPGMREGEILRYGIIAKKLVTESDTKVAWTLKSSSSKQSSGPHSVDCPHISGLSDPPRENTNNRTSSPPDENIGNLQASHIQGRPILHSRPKNLYPETRLMDVTSSDLEAAMNVDYSDEGRSPFLSFHFPSRQMGPDNPNSCNRAIENAGKGANCILIPSSPLPPVVKQPAPKVGGKAGCPGSNPT